MPLNQESKANLFDPKMRPLQNWVDLGVMAIRGWLYTTQNSSNGTSLLVSYTEYLLFGRVLHLCKWYRWYILTAGILQRIKNYIYYGGQFSSSVPKTHLALPSIFKIFSSLFLCWLKVLFTITKRCNFRVKWKSWYYTSGDLTLANAAYTWHVSFSRTTVHCLM